jgi:hypothetical protein
MWEIRTNDYHSNMGIKIGVYEELFIAMKEITICALQPKSLERN